MNLSPGAVLVIIVVVAVTNILIALAVVARARAQRARRFAEVDALLAAATRDDRSWYDSPGPSDTSLPSVERWPTAVQQLSSASDGWPASGALGAAGARRADPAGAIPPFESPAPTPLEQRAAPITHGSADSVAAADAGYDETADEDDDDDEWIGDDDGDDDDGDDDDDDEDDEDAEDDEDDMDVNGTDGRIADADQDERAEAEIETADDADEDADAEGDIAEPAPPAASPAGAVPFGRDALTGLADAMAFDEAMAHEEAREQRYGHPATVIVFELEGLAKLVDRLGSEPGDRIETALGDTIKRLARRADYVARLERGRYAALLPETDEVAAINYVERIRRACELWLESGAIAMRLAIGWASTTGDAGLSGAVRVATDRMRAELRRNARQVGDETAGVDQLDASQQAEVA